MGLTFFYKVLSFLMLFLSCTPNHSVVVPCHSCSCWYILEHVAFLAKSCFPTMLQLRNPEGTKQGCIPELQASQRRHFLTEKEEGSLQPFPPCHGALLWHICALEIFHCRELIPFISQDCDSNLLFQ